MAWRSGRFEAHALAGPVGSVRAPGLGDLRVRLHEAEHALDVGERLADLAVEHAEEVERDVSWIIKALTSTMSPIVISPLATRSATRHIIASPRPAMIAAWPTLSADSEYWLDLGLGPLRNCSS